MTGGPRKLVTVLGARPQFVKASVVSRALAASGTLAEVVVHTGQHFDANMSDVFFADLEMAPPAHHLGVHGGAHGSMTGRMLEAVERVLVTEAPRAVLVYGDTNSTLAGALAAVKLRIPVAHVEAGLRTFNLDRPEEVNRVVTDRISSWLYPPTAAAAAHLVREGVPAERIVEVGDVMYDAVRHFADRAATRATVLATLNLAPGGYVLATLHRAENTDHPARLAAIVDALLATSAHAPIVWPLHPRTRARLADAGRLADVAAHLVLIGPVGYLDMVQLERHAALVVTDSGGVQKEAFFHRVPCVTLRDETEWVELVETGWNRLASPADPSAMPRIIRDALGTAGQAAAPYGDGTAAPRIAAHLERALR